MTELMDTFILGSHRVSYNPLTLGDLMRASRICNDDLDTQFITLVSLVCAATVVDTGNGLTDDEIINTPLDDLMQFGSWAAQKVMRDGE